ncbi:metal transporter Nramp2-like protein [Tanacetum coccineum]|uniref:Metal transporter Nramp2-like protein n=1 Tax=Tanacetum coccineum TaxID=301880 RepID=A0ABQ4Z5B5_9ASTR
MVFLISIPFLDPARVRVATGKHLAELCKDAYPKWVSLCLWFMAELALIGVDIHEVIGSAVATQILSNGVVPIWVGVVITASDCRTSECESESDAQISESESNKTVCFLFF